MNWSSWGEFLAMGGYGPYVWGAYLIALAVVIVELILLRLRHRNILRYFGNAQRDVSPRMSLNGGPDRFDNGPT
jgi:heme exporter protein D